MKTLSLKQPWADWVVDGKKTIETRTWNTKVRGRIRIHASKKPDFKCNPNALGAVIGSVEIVDVKLYTTEKEWRKDEKKHMDKRSLKEAGKDGKKYGFILKNAKRVKPIYCKGRLGFWG